MTRRAHLARSCALAQILRDSSHTAAHDLFVTHPTAMAVAIPDHSLDANACWQELFGSGAELPAQIDLACAPVSGGTLSVEDLEITIAGRRHVVALHATNLHRPDGRPCGVIVACSDNTDEVVRRDLHVSSDTLVWGGMQPGHADYFSGAWRASRIVPAMGWLEAFHPEDAGQCHGAVDETRRHRVSKAFDARIAGRNGHYRWYRVRLVARPDGSWFGTAVDVHDASLAKQRAKLLATARKAQQGAERANRLKDEFLAMVSHELRGPLATLLLWEKVLRDATTDAATREQALDAIHQSARAQSRLVGDLLDVSRAITGKLYISTRWVDLQQLAREALDTARAAASAKGIEVRSQWLDRSVELEGDPIRILQVLDNVLANAIKFTPRGGTVALAVHQRVAETIEIVVSDDGRGIAPELLPHIFEPFAQSADILTRSEGGLGLGLAVAHSIVTLHGGTVTATSPGPGLGTVVTVAFPAGLGQRPAPAAPRRVPALAGVHVLVVDDDSRVCAAIALLLQRAHADVRTASSAAEARVALASARCDVIICDIAMPGEDGYEFVRSLRDADTVTPAIALTAFATDTYAERALESGFNRHLAKPIQVERLIDCIDELHSARLASQIT